MTPNDYQKLALRTEGPYADRTRRAGSIEAMRMSHAVMGLTTETGELTDTVKKWIFYGQEVDTVNVKEEIGDVLWYLALACNALNIPLEACMESNIAKLRKRFPEQYTNLKAVTRDLDAERKALEGDLDSYLS